jgi:hypothetical protein
VSICTVRDVPLTDAQVAALDPDGIGWWCCWGSTLASEEDGTEASIRACTCWTPVYDLEQQPLAETSPPSTRIEQCHDCAYLATTAADPDRYPEQRDRERLFELGPDEPFYCHVGMRRIVAWEHPAGHRIEAAQDDYASPTRGRTAFKADGTSADRCAGWARIVEAQRA